MKNIIKIFKDNGYELHHLYYNDTIIFQNGEDYECVRIGLYKRNNEVKFINCDISDIDCDFISSKIEGETFWSNGYISYYHNLSDLEFDKLNKKQLDRHKKLKQLGI